MSEENIIFVMLEGKHDAAVLTRLLRDNGYSNFTDKKIKQFPTALKGYFQSKIEGFVYEDEANIWQKPQLPNYICKEKQGSRWFVFYEMGGDSSSEPMKALLRPFQEKKSELTTSFGFAQPSISILFFFDADKDLQARKNTFFQQYKDFIANFSEEVLHSSEEQKGIFKAGVDGFRSIGLFVYNLSGTLEDIVVPLMQQGQEEHFANATSYLDHYLSDTASSKYKKALIGVVGQPKNPGKANQSILADTKMLNQHKFNTDDTFREIVTFFQKF